MATPKILTAVSNSWTDIIGSAAAVAGVTWQNVGVHQVMIAFTTTAPAGGATDAYHLLNHGEAFYDKNGSAHCWAKCIGNAGSTLSATAD